MEEGFQNFMMRIYDQYRQSIIFVYIFSAFLYSFVFRSNMCSAREFSSAQQFSQHKGKFFKSMHFAHKFHFVSFKGQGGGNPQYSSGASQRSQQTSTSSSNAVFQPSIGNYETLCCYSCAFIN